MSKRTKVLLIVGAIVLVCMFSGALANQTGTGTGDANSRNGLVDFLGRRAGNANAVADGEVQAPCRKAANRFDVTGGSCTLTVAAGGAGLRSLHLRSNSPITVTSKVPRRDFTVSDDVKPGDEVKVAIDSGGGQVALTCAPLATCVVMLNG
jgi:hypothetical protein